MSAGIRSRWEIPATQMEKHHIDYLMNSKLGNSIINNGSKEFQIKFPQYDYNEIRTTAVWGFYKAINSFNPPVGFPAKRERAFINHAYYTIRSYVYEYFRKTYRQEKIESYELSDDDFLVEIEDDLLSNVILGKVFKNLNEEDREVLFAFYYLCDNPKQCKEYLGLTWFKMEKKLNNALKKARKCLKLA